MRASGWMVVGLVGLHVCTLPAFGQEGWSGKGEETEPAEVRYEPLTELDQKRYRYVCIKLMRCLIEGKKDEYRSMFTDKAWEEAPAWWREMFAEQVKHFGEITRAYAPTRSVIRGEGFGMQGPFADGAAFVVQFADDGGALLSLRLDEHGLIEAVDVFVLRILSSYRGEKAQLIYDETREPMYSPLPEDEGLWGRDED